MMVSVLAEDKAEVFGFYRKVKERNGSLKYPFFTLSSRLFRFQKGGVLVVSRVKINVPRVYWLAVIPLALFFIFGKAWLGFLTVVLLSWKFFYSSIFFYLTMRAGMRKAGYRGVCKLVSSENALEAVVLNGAGRNIRVV